MNPTYPTLATCRDHGMQPSPGEVAQQLEQLDTSTELLSHRIEALELRLVLVTRSVSCAAGCKAPPEPLVPMAARIRESNERVLGALSRLEALLANIEL